MFAMRYKTIDKFVNSELIIKKSRFIALLFPVSVAQETAKLLSGIRQSYPGANHYCYAYIIRQNGSKIERCDDNGEPTGTAGWPMLNVLQKMELENVMAVVVRYFGGILLGTGGLVKAYTQSMQTVIDKTRIVNMEYCQMVSIALDYSYYGQFARDISHIFKNANDIQFTNQVNISIWVPVEQIDSFVNQVRNLSQGSAIIRLETKNFIPFID